VCARTDESLRLLEAVDTHVAGAIPCSVVTFGTDRHGLAVGRQADGESRSFTYLYLYLSLEQAVNLVRFFEATAAPGTQIGTPPRLTRVGPPK
jgi:hypothetical protein